MEKILMLLDNNARMTVHQIAAATGMSLDEVNNKIAQYEDAGVIKGYKTLIDWEKTNRNYVSAQITVKISLVGSTGFDDICELLAGFEEVEAVTLMSGSYDVALTVSARTFQDIAQFVASKLSPLEGVQSTSTSFVLKIYKDRGIRAKRDEDIREGII